MLTLVFCAASAFAADTVVSAGVASSITGTTGPIASDGSAFNPTLQFGVRPRVGVRNGRWSGSAAWAVRRTSTFCDTCGGDFRSGSLRAVDSDDLLLMGGPRLGSDERSVAIRGDVVLPASRDAFVCNPFYGAVGVGTTLSVAAGRSVVSASGSARRSFFRYDAVPVGRKGCSRPLDAPVETLSGAVDPTPWLGARYTTPNTVGAANLFLSWQNPHRLIRDGEVLFTTLSLGVNGQVRSRADATMVDTLAGPVAIDDARVPWVASLPASATVGWNATDHLSAALMLSNAVPAVLTDPGATFRNLPATTALTFTLDGHW